MNSNIHGTVSAPQPQEVTMKNSRKRITLAAAMFAFAAIMTPQMVMALPFTTAPCTEISNQAELAYEVGGVPQTDVLSDDGTAGPTPTATTFNVGVRVDVLVDGKDGAANVPVTPGTTPAVLTFTVTNEGNAIHDYDLSQIVAADGTVSNTVATDDFSLLLAGPDALLPEDGAGSDVTLWLESGANAGFLDTEDIDMSGLTPANVIQNLDPENVYPNEGGIAGTRTVYVVYTPSALTAANEQVSVSYLKAATLWADGTALPAPTGGNYTVTVTNDMTADTVCTAGGTSVDVVVGDPDDDGGGGANDAARDGAALDKSAFVVESAEIDILKSYEVISDGINTAGPYMEIPGAVIEYTLAISNSGDASATLNDITDVLDTNFMVMQSDASWTGPAGRAVSSDSGLTPDLNDTDNDAFGHDAPTAVGGTLTVQMQEILPAEGVVYSIGELKAGETVTVKFRATIQ